LVDFHGFLDGSETEEAVKWLDDSLSDEEKQEIKDMIKKHFEGKDEDNKEDKSRGDSPGGAWHFVKTEYVKPKRKWEIVIRRWAKKLLRNEFDNFEHWMRINRRIVMLPEEIVLPTEMEVQEREDDGKIQVYFFLDTSGSCSHLADRFWRAAMSVPKDRFDKRLFCFDTKVYEVSEKEKKLYGFGGTSFDIIEKRIQDDVRKGVIRSYPQAVFVITDGYGNQVNPEKPERWHWFMSTHGNYEKSIPSWVLRMIPKKCKFYNLSDFE
jgi:hypothetical protein